MDDQPPLPVAPPPRLRDDGEAGKQSRPAPPPVPQRAWRSTLWLLLVLVAVAGLATWLALRTPPQRGRAGHFQTSGPLPVGTSLVRKADMPIRLSALGTVTPLAAVTVKTQIAGQLVKIGFKEGQMVKKGDFLAQIDPRPYQVALAQAEAQRAKDEASLKNAEVDLARYQKLAAQNSIARQTLDTQAATVQQDKALVQADRAQIDAQKLNLTYCHIVAPISGRVGLRQVDAGNYVQTSDPNGIVVITQIQPISVIFTLPEDDLREVLSRVHAGARLHVVAFDRTDTTKLDSGTLETVDNQIDTSTGTVKLRAVFDNVKQVLFPNQFVNVQLLVNTLHDADTVPISAIQRGAPGTFVYAVMPDNTVNAVPVTLGPGNSRRVAVLKGLEPGQRVVTDGADRLKDGARVRLVDAHPGRSSGAAGAAPAAAAPSAPRHRPGGGQHRRRGGE